MNSKGQVGVGLIIILAITLIVGVIFFQSVAQSIGTVTNTVAMENDTTMTIAVNGTAQYVTTCRALSGVVIFNETGDVPVPSDQYAVVNNVIHPTTGDLSVSITPDAAAAYKTIWTIDATCQPLTYVADSGSRAMVSLILVFFALMLVAVSLSPVMQGKLLEAIGK